MEWEDFSEEIQELFELTDNWIDDIGNVYDYVSDKNIDEYIYLNEDTKNWNIYIN